MAFFFSSSMALSCSDSVVRLGLAITDFALALLPHLSEDDGADNVFFSPLSLVSALAMTRLGARQATASQIHAALRLTRILESDVHSAFGEINALLNTTGVNTYLLKIANRLFANMDYTFLEEYLSMTRQHYDAEAQALDFAGDSEGSRVTINDWIEEQTAGKIRDLLPPDSINSLTAMVLTNAIYFKGDWKEQFDHRDTHPEPFHLTPDDTIEVDMMHKEDTYHVGFSEELDCKSVELPYKGGDLSMVLIIPNKLCGLKEVEGRINANNIKPLIICPDKMKVMVSLPKFKLEFESQLKSKLQSLGMTDAFEYGKADFSGMDGTQQLYISEVGIWCTLDWSCSGVCWYECVWHKMYICKINYIYVYIYHLSATVVTNLVLALLACFSSPIAAYMCQWIGSALGQIMACRLCGTKPLSKPMLVYCQLNP